MSDKPKERIILVKEKTLQSIVSDLATYGIIVASFYFNYKFIGGNDALDVLLFITFFLVSAGNIKHYKVLFEKIEKEKA